MPALGLSLLVSTAAYLMVFTMLAQVGASLQASGALLGWIVIGTIIAGTVCAVLFPALGAVTGQRRLMMIAMGSLAAGSVVSAIAPDAATLLAGRIIACPGFAATALSLAIVREHRSGPSLTRAISVIAAFEGAAAGVGFVLGGVVEQLAGGDWRPVFLAMAAIAAMTGALGAVCIPRGARAPRRVDVLGALLLGTGMVAALLPITEGAAWGWTSWRVIGLLAGAVVLLSAWAVTELGLSEPLVRLTLLTLPGVAGGAVLWLVISATVSVVNLTIPSFLQAPAAAGYGAAASVLDVGLAMLPFALTITAAGFTAGRLVRVVDARLIAVAGLACEGLGLGLLTGFHAAPAEVVILVALFGAGHGSTLAVAYVLLTRAAPEAAAGSVAGLGSAVSGISGAVGSAVTTALLAGRLVRVGPAALPAAVSYDHAWLFAVVVAAAGALAAAAAAGSARTRSRTPDVPALQAP